MFESSDEELRGWAKENGFRVKDYRLANHKRKWRIWLDFYLFLLYLLVGFLGGLMV